MEPVDNVVTTSRNKPSHPFMSNGETNFYIFPLNWIVAETVNRVRRTESDKLTEADLLSIVTNLFDRCWDEL